jgi:hypothetical protein
MRENGWTWDQLADSFARRAEGPPVPLDGGAADLRMARWARSQARAADERRAAADDPDRPDPRPDDAQPDPPLRQATPPRPARRG